MTKAFDVFFACDVIALQELTHARDYDEVIRTPDGHAILVSRRHAGCLPTGLAVHRDWLPHLREVHHAARYSSVVFIAKGSPGADDVVVQCLFVHSPRVIHHHTDEVGDLCRQVHDSMRSRRTIRLLGGDLSVHLADEIGGDVIGKALCKHSATTRQPGLERGDQAAHPRLGHEGVQHRRLVEGGRRGLGGRLTPTHADASDDDDDDERTGTGTDPADVLERERQPPPPPPTATGQRRPDNPLRTTTDLPDTTATHNDRHRKMATSPPHITTNGDLARARTPGRDVDRDYHDIDQDDTRRREHPTPPEQQRPDNPLPTTTDGPGPTTTPNRLRTAFTHLLPITMNDDLPCTITPPPPYPQSRDAPERGTPERSGALRPMRVTSSARVPDPNDTPNASPHAHPTPPT